MQLIRPDQILGFLRDLPILSGQKLWADRSVQNIHQNFLQPWVVELFRFIGHQMANQGFRDRGVNPIHGHVVTIVCSPSQGQFRQVTRTDNQSSYFIGIIHQNLRTFTRL